MSLEMETRECIYRVAVTAGGLAAQKSCCRTLVGTNDLVVAPSVSERLRARGPVGDDTAERYVPWLGAASCFALYE